MKAPAEAAKAGLQLLDGPVLQIGAGGDAHCMQFPRRHLANTENALHRQRADEGIDLLRPHHLLTVGLVPVVSDLGEKFVGRDASRGRQPFLFADVATNLGGDEHGAAVTVRRVADIEKRLAQRQQLDQRRQSAASALS